MIICEVSEGFQNPSTPGVITSATTNPEAVTVQLYFVIHRHPWDGAETSKDDFRWDMYKIQVPLLGGISEACSFRAAAEESF